MTVIVDFDKTSLCKRLKGEAEIATEDLAKQVLEDCNLYCRELTGELIRSSYRASDIKSGRLVWDTPYAKRVYYTGEARTGVNPQASKLWGEAAKAAHLNEWERLWGER
jgi:hypothetical protein